MKIIITESQYKLLTENNSYEYGALLLELNIKDWPKILDGIDKLDLYRQSLKYGLETEPHLTIVFGIEQNVNVKELINFVKSNVKGPISVILHGISTFQTNTYDFLKFDVICPTIVKLNKLIKQNFNIHDRFPNYIPHVTIAALKPGAAKKYMKKNVVITGNSSLITYSPPNGPRIKFKI